MLLSDTTPSPVKALSAPRGTYLIFEALEGGLLERGTYLKIQVQGYQKLDRDVEERTGQESFDSEAHEIRNWQYYDQIHHEHSLNHCTLL